MRIPGRPSPSVESRRFRRRVTLLLLGLAALARATFASPPIGTRISEWEVRKGEIRDAFRLQQVTASNGIVVRSGRARASRTTRKTALGSRAGRGLVSGRAARLRLVGPRSNLVLVELIAPLPDRRVLEKKLGEYFDPPLGQGVRSGLGGAHARKVTVRRPAPYAFRNRNEEPVSGRVTNASIGHLAELARNALPGVTASRSRVYSKGILLHDPYLEWVAHRLDEAVERREPIRVTRGGNRIDLVVDEHAGHVRLRIHSNRLPEATLLEVESALEEVDPVTPPDATTSTRSRVRRSPRRGRRGCRRRRSRCCGSSA